MKKLFQNSISKVVIALVCLLVVNYIAKQWHTRIDLTQDKRYTLSEVSKKTLAKIQNPIVIDVLLKGNIPTEFKKLQTETIQLLDEYAAANNNIIVNFINPLEGEEHPESVIQELINNGYQPLQITQNEAGKSSIEYIFPWAVISDGKKSERVRLFVNKLGSTDQEQVQNSVQKLEYNFTDALYKFTLDKKKKIAILRSNGALEDIYMADFLKTAREYYFIAPFTLDSVATNPEKTLHDLEKFDLLLVPKPTEPFTDAQKQVVDQYIMNGGRALWLIDNVAVSLEDMYKTGGMTMAMPINLNLTDMFFQYGFRINYTLVNDLYFSEIIVATGDGSQTRYMPIPWVYNPLVISGNNHLINNHLDAVRFQFANSIDTLKNGVKKTVLLASSPFSKADGTPREINLRFDPNNQNKEAYKHGNIPLVVLLEGEFNSVYKDRIRPINLKEKSDRSKPTKMLVVADGDIIKNDIDSKNNIPLELGFDKWTSKYYDNKSFLQNALNYLLDDTEFLSLRNKKVQLAFLDKQKVAESVNSWQIKVFVYPLLPLILVMLSVLYFYRKKNIRKV
ncbi:gliding motility-associated ABC transporter substrate-binding protein GldG [Capnocytophaga sputigena]|jgi:gliding-associated putative ABC transporter substrate-binding component gldG|uniref:gliding motility-associated ABC transporter substrate-binding protein GldG n=1 Tax=Capnocytophaga sputigena TaxID=1019 RepID=UPI000BB1A853|nr:gliding motility-associated ABC transporter substrate-binding protein GldG [Capnocytophaga sputigena]ATA69578.1 gliding motility-associated ABC transporter substrate-binding protein GldG [Capnocytophaga sputigena]VEI52617.1 gliding-associated putative ABC transporter substrate-binding component GldG [Capnocytophaga sputigena]